MTLERLSDLLPSVVRDLAAQHMAKFCAEPHPLDEATLCARLAGHPGNHTFDGLPPWADTEEMT